jgi:type II secretory pathway component PulJ
MIDVVVAMTLMSLFMAMFTGGIVQMYRSANETEAMSTAQAQLTTSFLRLDAEIRYAAGISAPGLVGADSYVEYLITNTGVAMCTELRLDVASGQLQRRSWARDATPPAPSGWNPLASDVSSPQPFTRSAADSTYNFQRLRLNLVASAGGGTTGAAKQTDVTFTALNTTLLTDSDTVCADQRLLP